MSTHKVSSLSRWRDFPWIVHKDMHSYTMLEHYFKVNFSLLSAQSHQQEFILLYQIRPCLTLSRRSIVPWMDREDKHFNARELLSREFRIIVFRVDDTNKKCRVSWSKSNHWTAYNYHSFPSIYSFLQTCITLYLLQLINNLPNQEK